MNNATTATAKSPPPAVELLKLGASERVLRMDAAHAGIELDDVLRAAGLHVSTKIPADDGPGPLLALSPFDAETAAELTRLLRKGMKRTYKTAEALRATFDGHGLKMPGICVDRARIRLGDIPVPIADRLACLLGAPHQDDRTGDRRAHSRLGTSRAVRPQRSSGLYRTALDRYLDI
ncbi:hypothetical protein [Streptomyces sp. NPDC091212]|uniref:hypothetical protein n=1 Tax=Streptomyces sp. NPDC091212 TaxID=3155191 RepID=UPI003423DC66